MIYDLHVHTNISDSNLSPEKVIEIARKKKIDVLAITDHDTIDSYRFAKDLSDLTDIWVIGGLEISAYDFENQKRVHILGYDFEPDDKDLNRICEKTIKQRNEASYKAVEMINQNSDFYIDPEKIKDYEGGSGLYKQHIMQYLKDSGKIEYFYGPEYKQFFSKNYGYAYFPIEYPDYREAIQIIKNAGGIPIIAHAYLYDSMKIIDPMLEAGLMGLEAAHPKHTPEMVKTIVDFCKKKDLLITCGSDWHGDYSDHNYELGSCTMYQELIQPFIKSISYT